MRRLLAFLVIVLASWLILQLQQSNATNVAPGEPPVASVPATASVEPSPSRSGSGKGFRDREHLADHYAKHGNEFPGLSQAQYLAMAQTLRDAQVGESILEVVRSSDGVVSRFDKNTGAFIAFDRDGTIRTFFKPNDGERYFRRQANRAPSR